MATMTDDEFLEAYRLGIGAAIRTIDRIADRCTHPCIAAEFNELYSHLEIGDIIQDTLRGVINGLRVISASTQLDEERHE